MLIRFCLLWNEAFVLLPQLPKLLLHFLYTPEVRWDVGIIARPKTSAQLDQGPKLDLHAFPQAPSRSPRQLGPCLLRRHVSGVPVRPVRVVLPVTLLVLAVGGCRAPHRACQIVC